MSEQITPGVFHGICQTPVNGKVLKFCEANKKLLAGWIQEDQNEVPSVAWFQKVLQESPRYAEELVWDSADRLDPTRRRALAAVGISESRMVFGDAARHLGFSECEANFQHACDVLGRQFTKVQFQQAYSFGSLTGLLPATAEERAQWNSEQIKAENKFVRDATSPYELSQAKQIVHSRRVEQSRSLAQQRLEHDLVITFERECVFGPKQKGLPKQWLGQPLTIEFIKKSDAPTLKKIMSIYGHAQINARLFGITRATTTIDRGDGKGPREVSYSFE
jgi:hypothetical protein